MEHLVTRITDPDVLWLASIGETLRPDYINVEQDLLWKDSPFDWIRRLPSRRKGKVGEQLVAGWCAAKGFDVIASGDSDADRVIAGKRVEIKMSTLWENGTYKFQQLRDQHYAYVICLGISPFDAHCWVIPKAVVWSKTPPQHGGSRGSDTRWLSFQAASPDAWLAEHGGRLSQVWQIMNQW